MTTATAQQQQQQQQQQQHPLLLVSAAKPQFPGAWLRFSANASAAALSFRGCIPLGLSAVHCCASLFPIAGCMP